MADWKNVHLAEQDEKIADLTRRLAEAEADGTQETARAEHATMRANVAEARVRELEAKLEQTERRHINAYEDIDEVIGCGLQKQIKMSRKILDIEAERDALRERCEKLDVALHIAAQDLAFVANHSANTQLATMARKASNDAYAARSAATEAK